MSVTKLGLSKYMKKAYLKLMKSINLDPDPIKGNLSNILINILKSFSDPISKVQQLKLGLTATRPILKVSLINFNHGTLSICNFIVNSK